MNLNRPNLRVSTAAMALLVLAACCVLGGCSSATITNTWRDPNFVGPIHFKKVVVLALHADGAVRRDAEDEMVKIIGPDRAVAGYTILNETDRTDIKQLISKLRSMGIDGAITIKLLGSRQQTTFVPGSAGYPPFGEYYVGGDPGMVVTDTIASVQVNIYSVTDGKLIWASTSDVIDPSNAKKVVGDVAQAVRAALQKENLL